MFIKLLITVFELLHQENMQLAKMIGAICGKKTLENVEKWVDETDKYAFEKIKEIIDTDNEVDDGK